VTQCNMKCRAVLINGQEPVLSTVHRILSDIAQGWLSAPEMAALFESALRSQATCFAVQISHVRISAKEHMILDREEISMRAE
jgi:hypothetical protein